MSEYTEQAENFLTKHKLTFRAVYVDHDVFFDGDKDSRDIYTLTITGNPKTTVTGTRKQRLTVRFGQSITGSKNGDIPTAYDMLACITDYDPDTFENFCSDFGYDSDSRSAEKTYRAVKKEWAKVSRFFTAEQLDEVREIN